MGGCTVVLLSCVSGRRIIRVFREIRGLLELGGLKGFRVGRALLELAEPRETVGRRVPAVRWVGAERTEAVEFKVRGVPAVRWVGAERTEAVEFKV